MVRERRARTKLILILILILILRMRKRSARISLALDFYGSSSIDVHEVLNASMLVLYLEFRRKERASGNRGGGKGKRR